MRLLKLIIRCTKTGWSGTGKKAEIQLTERELRMRDVFLRILIIYARKAREIDSDGKLDVGFFIHKLRNYLMNDRFHAPKPKTAPKYELLCVVCGTWFTSNKPDRMCCSRTCAWILALEAKHGKSFKQKPRQDTRLKPASPTHC